MAQTPLQSRITVYRSSQALSYCLMTLLMSSGGCCGYQQTSLFPGEVSSIRLEMFDNRSFRRDLEFSLSDALAKRIEAETPYKIITHTDHADSVMSGQITGISEAGLTTELDTGKALEKEILIQATVTWKDLKTGALLLDAAAVEATASYSEFLNQGVGYAGQLAANKLAQRIVERMEQPW